VDVTETETDSPSVLTCRVSEKRIWMYELPHVPVHRHKRQESSDQKEGTTIIPTAHQTHLQMVGLPADN